MFYHTITQVYYWERITGSKTNAVAALDTEMLQELNFVKISVTLKLSFDITEWIL